jgi:hypothetical protein
MHQAVAVTIPPEDRKLVASALTDEQWDQIVLVENAIQVIDNTRVFARRALGFNADAFGPELAPLEHQILQQNFPKFELAAAALLSVIEAEEVETSVEARAAGQDETAESRS